VVSTSSSVTVMLKLPPTCAQLPVPESATTGAVADAVTTPEQGAGVDGRRAPRLLPDEFA
jgi:hypothetical protein